MDHDGGWMCMNCQIARLSLSRRALCIKGDLFQQLSSSQSRFVPCLLRRAPGPSQRLWWNARSVGPRRPLQNAIPESRLIPYAFKILPKTKTSQPTPPRNHHLQPSFLHDTTPTILPMPRIPLHLDTLIHIRILLNHGKALVFRQIIQCTYNRSCRSLFHDSVKDINQSTNTLSTHLFKTLFMLAGRR